MLQYIEQKKRKIIPSFIVKGRKIGLFPLSAFFPFTLFFTNSWVYASDKTTNNIIRKPNANNPCYVSGFFVAAPKTIFCSKITIFLLGFSSLFFFFAVFLYCIYYIITTTYKICSTLNKCFRHFLNNIYIYIHIYMYINIVECAIHFLIKYDIFYIYTILCAKSIFFSYLMQLFSNHGYSIINMHVTIM